jgi:hypothetical protein
MELCSSLRGGHQNARTRHPQLSRSAYRIFSHLPDHGGQIKKQRTNKQLNDRLKEFRNDANSELLLHRQDEFRIESGHPKARGQ